MTDIRTHSVTAGDQGEARQVSGGGVVVTLGPSGLLSHLPALAHGTGLPAYGTRWRDWTLRASPFISSLWAGAVYKATTKQVALGFQIRDAADSTRRIEAAQRLLLTFDGAYVRGMSKLVRDYLTQNNGAFVEVVYRGARPAALFSLDSARCERTGDAERPVVYTDLRNRQHLLQAHEVLVLEDTPHPDPAYRGMGQCAADRGWENILKSAAIETYFREKVTGTRNLAIHIVTGVSDVQLQDALASTEAAQAQRGFVLYRGSTILPSLRTETPGIVTIPLAEIPDGFDVREERQTAALYIALAIGLDPAELGYTQPAGLNSGQTAVVLNDAAEGQGLAAFRSLWQHLVSHSVLPGSTTYIMGANDVRDRREKAEADNVRAQVVKAMVEMQAITPGQALNILVDEGIAPPEFLATDGDETAAGAVGDLEKLPDEPTTEQQPAPEEVMPVEVTTEKADDLDEAIDAELDAALRWARLVQRGN